LRGRVSAKWPENRSLENCEPTSKEALETPAQAAVSALYARFDKKNAGQKIECV
jgi:hypothetical protein